MDIRKFLKSSYDKNSFVEFIFTKFYGFEENIIHYDEPEQEDILRYKFFGSCELDDDKQIGFYEFQTNKDIENNRVSLNSILKRKIDDELLDGAIAVFVNPNKPNVWRLSFVRFSYNENDKQQVTSLKRYTYILGEDIAINTAYNQLKDLRYPKTIDLLEEAFSVEKISKEFFDEYKKLYYKISDYLKPYIAQFQTQNNINLFTKKLLGRIVFLYFIEKKGWLNSDENWQNGDKNFLTKCFNKKYKDYNDFYHEILKSIFFKALNKDRREDNDLFPTLNCRIPFLNGGLFSEDEFDKLEIIIENDIFKEIFETFDKYNFTIIEDSPNDSEVAIDPEILGKVFESLLEDRKEKGAFYTPREIVHHMSRKSIEYYLYEKADKYNYLFNLDEFLEKTKLGDDDILDFYKKHPVKFLKLENYFEESSLVYPYKHLVIDFYIVAKIKGYLLNSAGVRVKNNKSNGHLEITSIIWHKILDKNYEVIDICFGSNKEIKKDKKSYQYPTILKYIKIDERYFTLAFLPNVWGDLELTTVFQIRYKEILRKQKKFNKSLSEITSENFIFNEEVFCEVKKLREDCCSLHTESLHQGAKLPRQAVIQKGLSTFRNFFCIDNIANKSLKEFLNGKDYYNTTINKLLNNSRVEQTKLKDILLHQLKNIKVLDPAIGSGAFPMGVLHEIVELRRQLGDDKKLVDLKKEIIENCIYGIDIEQSAVEIAKLRFWLSIVVDEETPTPLPNLFYKIMVGNSLIETINGFDPFDDKQDQGLFGDDYKLDVLQDKLHEYYREWNESKKEKINDEINNIIDEVLDVKLQSFNDKMQSQLKNANIFNFNQKNTRIIQECQDNISLIKKVKQRPTKDVFFYKLYFGEVLKAGGFDVIIGNPPYIKEYTSKLAFERTYDLECYQGKMDIWYLFACKGIDLLKDDGILSYIATNNWISNSGASKFRNKILQNTKIKEFIDFGDYKVFDTAGVQTMVLITQKTKDNETYQCNYSKVVNKNINKMELVSFLDKKESSKFSIFKSSVNSNELINQNITFLESHISEVLDNIENNRNFNLDKDKEITNGIQVQQETINKKSLEILGEGYELNEGIFNLTTEEKDKLDFSSEELNLIKPLYTSNEVKRYSANTNNNYWVIYTDSSFKNEYKMQPYPNLKKHLDRFQKVITTDNKPYGIHRTRNEYFFKDEKILSLRKCVGKPLFSYVPFDSYVNQAFYIIKSKRISLKYLTALLNSKLTAFWLKYKGKMQGDNYQVDKEPILNIPIKNIEDTNMLEILVDYIIYLKENKKPEYISEFFERVVDIAVYELYFETELKENGFAILNILEDELVESNGNYETIENIYKKLSDKNHKVSYSVSFIDTLNLVKIIEGK
ncbi:MAG: Eco57I restriction-modification methylase domain-containing protein [Arcobacteraceae bacterium]|nr:Eco57I restriction-modification methylase domain-containing protein [Arcobacteraceae bacterium]